MKKFKKNSSRRKFIKTFGVAGGALLTSPNLALASEKKLSSIVYLDRARIKSYSKNISIGLIGAGGMGISNVNTILKHKGVRLIAVCDLFKTRLETARQKWGKNLVLTDNYKDILKNPEVDAIIIATPDHWHKQISIDALKAGKHVYCEKPMIHSIEEGHEVINAWKKSGKIFIVGSQGLSSLGNEKAKQLLEDGAIGELNYAEGFWARHSHIGAWQYPIPEEATPKNINWERFISNSVHRPFDPIRFFRWRNYLDYGTGMSGDLFVHLFSSLHFITNSFGPDKISAMGGLRFWKDGREVPDVLLGMFQYPETKAHPGFNLSLRCNFVDGTSGSTYLKLVGSKGSMDVKWDEVVVKRNDIQTSNDPFEQNKQREKISFVNDRKKIVPPSETVYKAQKGYKGAHYDHFGNFINAIKSGGTVVEDPLFGFRAAAPALLCNDSYFKNQFINWDPVEMKTIK
ncbi:Gfo/Idh/MocA family oxidoreductase [Tamlana fucoidanivorans]|uniref:Gfo/Idh/MocA family oxidoreductase n=1 Tax=Allotamlana fucoidanivorans TaxID=2583814 RepID=A0A5C4SQW5_9FLAO|nr:Gfo/Idh/MocA family oxidoreductase [Tamlana fucoidanivorans]TNJ46027.1 Gfo/Idh/MocA family oxidoreductase [Tamlana fucoidanivorans]